ncbi:exosome complex component RRP45A-like [Salvia hispanica]|uniref:exosome complex component RRP45A-like n=1 Tax=Salvia hispanica TaxID=49212 RepID=UPI002008F98C|nr:exosome complex component RRP45A-like [Salvia hispanica]
MEQRFANSWRMTVNEKKFIETALLSDLRTDGRGPFDYRNLTIQFGSEDGSSEVQLGQTRVMGFVTSQLVQPYRDRPNEGTLAIFTEFSPMADPSFEVGRPGESAVELGRIVDRGLRESRAIDTESLCVIAGKWVWSVRIDLHILDNCGNLIDAANIAALAALLTFRRPECTLGGEDGQEVIIHPPEVREPLPLIVHHLPIAVTFAFIGNQSIAIIDPSHLEEAVMGGKLTATLNTNGDVCAIQKAGGEGVLQSVVMQCLRIASVKAADITGKIKKAVELYKTSRDLKKIKRHPDSVNINNKLKDMEKPKLKLEKTSGSQSDDMEVESHSSKKDEHKRKAVIAGTSSWDPYSKVADADELKESLASQVVEAQQDQKMDVTLHEKQQLNAIDESLRDADPSPSLSVAAEAGDAKIKAESLSEAMKPKHKRKKKNLSNSDGS